ncbi:MAG: hypothetical protein PHE83_01140 [Opitutaceae bacterium]|nr:hypothetical protein [Opitutaceae bacterium]
MKALLRYWVAVFVVIVALAKAGEKEVAPWESPNWKRIETGIGNMGVDGTLQLSYTLGESDELKPLGIRWTLEHRIETDAYGQPHSAWRFDGLESLLAPAGREHLRWQPLIGSVVRFERAKIGHALSEAGAARWRIRETTPGDYEIRSLDGREWRYERGVLISGEHPVLGKLSFIMQGGLLREINQGDPSTGGAPLLRADYDAAARLVSLVIGAQPPQRFEWSEAGELCAWHRQDGQMVTFAYHDGLLNEVVEGGKTQRRFTWAENPGYARADSLWAAPVHLASDNASMYLYELSPKGFEIRRREKLTGTETVTFFNPPRRRMEQHVGDEVLVVQFHRSSFGVGGLDRIESGRGEVLEEYLYDDHDQVVAIKREGSPERTLSYDETGRLMSLQEIGAHMTPTNQ